MLAGDIDILLANKKQQVDSFLINNAPISNSDVEAVYKDICINNLIALDDKQKVKMENIRVTDSNLKDFMKKIRLYSCFIFAQRINEIIAEKIDSLPKNSNKFYRELVSLIDAGLADLDQIPKKFQNVSEKYSDAVRTVVEGQKELLQKNRAEFYAKITTNTGSPNAYVIDRYLNGYDEGHCENGISFNRKFSVDGYYTVCGRGGCSTDNNADSAVLNWCKYAK